MKGGINPRTIGLMAVAAIALGGGAVYMQYKSMTGAQARYKALDAEVPDEKEVKDNLAQTEVKLGEIQVQLDHLEKGVPTVAYVPTLLKELEQTGLASEIRVTGVRPVAAPPTPPGAMEEKPPYEEKNIDISGRGNYKAIIALLDRLQKFPKIVAVGTVGLNPRVTGTSTTYDYLEVTVRLKAYVFPEDAAEKTDADAKPVARVDVTPKAKGGV
jgi:type IV pilus assembly protein PilO